jgi:hypothetical protein
MPSTAIAAFAGILHKKILTMSLIHKNDRGEDYNSPEIMVINVATECGFATSTVTTKEYGVGIEAYDYDDDL